MTAVTGDQQALFDVGGAPKAKLGGKSVTEREWACVEAGLDEFNIQAHSKLGALRGDGRLSDAAVRIGMRARQWPALTPDDFRDLVRQGFRRPWWTGRPSVGVCFNPGIFENLLGSRSQAPPPEDEFSAYLRSLDGDDALDGHAVEIS
jgi:hypothetical protein